MASVFRSFLRSDHRFPCRYSDLSARGVFPSPRASLRGHCKRPDRHRKHLTPPKPMSSALPARFARGSGRRGSAKHPAMRSAPSVVQQARQQGFLRRRRG